MTSATQKVDLAQRIDPALIALKNKLDGILQFDTRARCIYIDYPLHTNVGDLLINLGAEQFFAENRLNIWRRYNYYDFPRRIPGIEKSDVLLLHGGGNFGDLWYNFQAFRERILDEYPENRIIFLPQTVHFSSSAKGQASVRRMNRHRNCHVFTRDSRSLDLLKSWSIRSASLMPDTAHALLGAFPDTGSARRNVALQLIRRDREASEIPAELRSLPGDVCDWDYNMFSFYRRLMHYFTVKTVKAVGRYGPPIDCHKAWYRHRDRLVHDAVVRFQRYDTVVTNRLHALLLGLLLGKKVFAFDNSYGKLSSYYETWLRGARNLTFSHPDRMLEATAV